MDESPLPDPAPDPVPLILRALAVGAALGVALQALVAWTVRTLQTPPRLPNPPSLSSGPALVLLLGTFGGILAAGTATWFVLTPIHHPWRQMMLAMIAGLGSFVLSLVTIPIDRGLGRAGLLGLAGVAAAVSFWMRRRP